MKEEKGKQKGEEYTKCTNEWAGEKRERNKKGRRVKINDRKDYDGERKIKRNNYN